MTHQEFKAYVWEWAKIVGVEPKEIHLRQMKRKWGSTSSKGRLTFDYDMLNLEEGKRKEHVLHELLHLKYK